MIEVFKTNVPDEYKAEHLAGILQLRYPGGRVTFDLDDCDKVLRIEGGEVDVAYVVRMINGYGFMCEVME